MHRKRTLKPIGLLAAIIGVAAACSGAHEHIGVVESELTAEQCTYFSVNGRTQICHFTGSPNHPYTILKVATLACANAHADHANDYIAINDPSCQGGGCLPLAAPCDATLPCCDGLACSNGTCVVACADLDGDGATTCGEDCDDADSGNFPGNPEACGDGRDNNCDGVAEEGCPFCSINLAGTLCEDGNACTGTDTCQAGSCSPGDPVICGPADQCHEAGTCDTMSGACSTPLKTDGTPCNDGNPYTLDMCQGGVCQGSPIDLDHDGHFVPNDCNDGDPNVNLGSAERCGDGVDNNCNGMTDEPCRSCRDTLSRGMSYGNGSYTVYPDGGSTPVQVYCDMQTDGGGWTLGANIASDLGPIDLFTYRNATGDPLSTDYGLDMRRMGLSITTKYRLGCIESSDTTRRKLFITGLDPAEPIFRAAGTVTKAPVVCSRSESFSDALTREQCFSSPWGVLDNENHTYYGNTAWDITWALFAFPNNGAQTLRHCAARGSGYHNKGSIWFRE